MTDAERGQIEGRPLLLYDGVCALCNGWVRFLLKRDRQGRLRFTPLEGSLGREVLERFEMHKAPDGVVLVTEALTGLECIYFRSDAVAMALQLLGNFWKMAGWGIMAVPRPLREFGYGLVARLRYRIFGRYDSCPLPTAEERDRILGVYE